MKDINVAIVGGSGYTGGELIRLLKFHPHVNINQITSRKHAGKKVSDLHPNLQDVDLKFTDVDDIDADVIFSALPHGVSMNIIPDLLENGSKVIDLSGDFRFNDIDTYEKWYGIEHKYPDLKAVFGLPEINRELIKDANLIANPGCFPTGAILSSLPLVQDKLVDHLIIDSKTGVSGAGVTPTNVTHYPICADNVAPYAVGTHRHMPEIQEQLRSFGNYDVNVSFTPHLVPVTRGILTTNHSFLKDDSLTTDDIYELYLKKYADELFVKVLDDNNIPSLNSIRGSNYCHIGGINIDENGHLVVISAIDNLVKGASGQAIQNMNIICGFDENESLKHLGLYP
ncbi:MAG: N-acetyl-gamma-glutamyl-phosphate reductase [Methanobacteriaceae archaeon]|nr:N-acetyl-gamma-glutamyl-phosphate reductase [Methanobacteriaceae archaeon]